MLATGGQRTILATCQSTASPAAHNPRKTVAAHYAAQVTEHTRPDAPPTSEHAQLRQRVLRRAKAFGVFSAALLLINFGSGAPFWSFWPGLAMGVLLGLQAAPLFARAGFTPRLARVTVVLAALLLVNLVTWSGYPWALWPIGVVLAIQMIRRLI